MQQSNASIRSLAKLGLSRLGAALLLIFNNALLSMAGDGSELNDRQSIFF